MPCLEVHPVQFGGLSGGALSLDFGFAQPIVAAAKIQAVIPHIIFAMARNPRFLPASGAD